MALIPIMQEKYVQMIEESTGNIVKLKVYRPTVAQGAYPYGFLSATVPDGFINISNISVGEEIAVWYRFADPSLHHFRLKIFIQSEIYIECKLYNDNLFVANLTKSSGVGILLTINNIKYGGVGIMLVGDNHYICGTFHKTSTGSIWNGITHPDTNLPYDIALERWFGDRKLIEIGYPGTPSPASRQIRIP